MIGYKLYYNILLSELVDYYYIKFIDIKIKTKTCEYWK